MLGAKEDGTDRRVQLPKQHTRVRFPSRAPSHDFSALINDLAIAISGWQRLGASSAVGGRNTRRLLVGQSRFAILDGRALGLSKFT